MPAPNTTPRPNARRLGNFMLVLAGLAFSFLVLEFAARTVFPPPQPWLYPQVRYQSDPELIFRLKPDQQAYTADKTVFVNQAGLRGPLIPYSRQPGTTRLLFLGDSIVFGYGVEEELAVSAQTASILTALGAPAEAVNTGVPSYNTVQETRYFELRGFRYRPDWVIVGFCWNDINEKSEVKVNADGYLVEGGWRESDSTRLSSLLESPAGVMARNFLKQSRLLFSAKIGWHAISSSLRPDSHTILRQNVLLGKNTELIESGWKQVASSVQKLKQLEAVHGFRLLIVAFPNPLKLDRIYPDSQYPSRLRQISNANSIPFIDLEPVYRARYTTHESLFIPYDGDHPNAAGHRLAAETIAAYLAAESGPSSAKQGAVNE